MSVGVGTGGAALVVEELSSNGDTSITTSELWGAIVLGFEAGCLTDFNLAKAVVLDLGGGFSARLVCVRAEVLARG